MSGVTHFVTGACMAASSKMHFYGNNLRKGSVSSTSSTSSLDAAVMNNTIPIAPREDDYSMPEKTRQARLLSKCKRSEKAPWRDAKPLPKNG
ncbi:hypothetical protein KC363_g1913 [Hortaea werneckii]|nr:hypothetical protein KC325_g5911 [Hortaea werneckii]KAI6991160.1 hypothetical protein KC359_g6294 [Hortaea werneckii]KAI7143957.1 hypothetical protein KC344_g5833 [Hortaea werneckii]KAI7172275.1 hypothetical protein KC360_g5645 [Hortaea werneckii]KAI7194924.1 hypothetical protein KC363_g1913 [Hortaea werneckii]